MSIDSETQVVNRIITDCQNKYGDMQSALDSVSNDIFSLTKAMESINEDTAKAATISSSTYERTAHSAKVMEDLSESVKGIKNISKLISDIAFQTELLSINAEIEAARAGKAGRGFSVVAKEVKNLAKSADEATQKISEQIKTVNEQSLTAVEFIKEVNDMISEINFITLNIHSTVNTNTTLADAIALDTKNTHKLSGETQSELENLTKRSNGIHTFIIQAFKEFKKLMKHDNKHNIEVEAIISDEPLVPEKISRLNYELQ